jgi:hypothetical protein
MKKRGSNRRRVRGGLLATLGTSGLILATAGADAAPLNTNLVVNGTFENVNLASTGLYNAPQVLDWSGLAGFAYSHDGSSSNAGVVPDYADGTPPAGAGHWYFTPGNTPDITGPGQFFQEIDVSSGPTAGAIAGGVATYRLSAFMSSYLNDTDFGNVFVEFLDSGGNNLDTAHITDFDRGPNNVWSENAMEGLVPVGTTALRVSLWGTRTEGGVSPDGYIDNLVFQISAVPEPSGAIVGAGLAALALVRRRRRDRP